MRIDAHRVGQSRTAAVRLPRPIPINLNGPLDVAPVAMHPATCQPDWTDCPGLALPPDRSRCYPPRVGAPVVPALPQSIHGDPTSHRQRCASTRSKLKSDRRLITPLHAPRQRQQLDWYDVWQ
jgi:hypothetical protein